MVAVAAVLLGLAAGEALAAQPASRASRVVPGMSDADLWAVADRMMSGLDGRWSEGRRAYAAPGHGAATRENSAMLATHSIAALTGHTGLARQDARARTLVDRLTTAPAWLGTATGPGSLSTCWSGVLDSGVRQHLSLESKVADALAWAWRARRALGLSAAAVRRIEETVGACARSPAWRYPRLLANQINWSAEMYASATTVTGRPFLLLHDYRLQLERFAAGITRPMPGERIANLGPGYQFHYDTDLPASAGINLDSPEYASIVVHAIAHYDRARRLGMPPLEAAAMRRMRAWVLRLLAGAWTHGGYLNWDTGKGRRRWHSAQYWAFAQQGLLAVATAPRFWLRPAEGRWAKALFDRSLRLFVRLADEAGGPLAPSHMFSVHTFFENYECFCARMLANVAHAVGLGLGSLPAQEPPPLYAFDHDTGRLAVSTPRYSTAIVPDNRGVFRYGGIDPARLFGPGQRVAANVGGTPPATFGTVVADRNGRELLASQHARVRRSPRLRIVRSPHGRITRPRAYPGRPYAGPFGDLEARGEVSRGRLRIAAGHRFRRNSITSRWQVSCTRRCRGLRVRTYFPTAGPGAAIEAVRRGATRVSLPSAGVRVPLADIASVHLGGYTMIPVRWPRGAALSVVRVRKEPTNPRPGPSLAVEWPATSGMLAVRVLPGK